MHAETSCGRCCWAFPSSNRSPRTEAGPPRAQGEQERIRKANDAEEQRIAKRTAEIEKEKQDAFELELFRKERDAADIENASLKAQALIEIERLKLEQELLNKELSDEQIVLLREKFSYTTVGTLK